jgi:hypothetical protein
MGVDQRPSAAAHVGAGAAREEAERKRQTTLVGVCCGLGLAAGVYLGTQGADGLMGISGPWDPALAVATAVVYVVALLAASHFLGAGMDEVKKSSLHKAGSFANSVFFFTYPVWFILWRGGIAPEPMHLVIFIGFWASLCLGSLYHRFR